MTIQDRWLLPEGVDEFLPRRAAVAERLRREILDLFKTWGYQLVIPPLIEFTDSLLVGMGEDLSHQSFRLTDQLSGRPMAVRADITSQTARIDAHSMQAGGVNRLCYAGSVLHALPKSLSASRCPIQAGAELYGNPDVSGDIEIISLMLEMLQRIDAGYTNTESGKAIHRLTLDLGHVAVYRAVDAVLQQRQPDVTAAQRKELFDAVQRKSVPDLKVLVPVSIADPSLAELIYQLPLLCGGRDVLSRARQLLADIDGGIDSALDELDQVADIIEQRFSDVSIYFDLTEMRGYDYHTGLVFAAYADGFGTALANGGRYDNIGMAFGSARPATGFNTDVKALIDFIHEQINTAGYVDAEQLCIAAPILHDQQLWEKMQSLRASGEQVISVDAKEVNAYARKLVKQKSGWKVV